MTPTRRVLIVDDDPEVTGLLEQILAVEGYTVEIARDGGSALGRLDQDIDIILLDVMMPGLNGLQVCRRIRAEERFGEIPIILVTALGGDQQRHAGFLAGADDYLSKPFTAHELLDRVHVWLRARERFRQAAAGAAEPDSHETSHAGRGRAELGDRAAGLEEQVLQVEGLMHYLVAEAVTRPGFLAALLMPYAQAQGWDEDELAQALGCPRATLTRLLLRPRPLELTWAADVSSIAEACGANPTTLGPTLRAAEAWERRSGSRVHPEG